jgi:hypothetical protein
MNDITALMGKLGANVAYLQFDAPVSEARAYRAAVQAPAIEDTVVDDFAEVMADFEDCPVSAGVWMRSRPLAPAPLQARSLADIFARLEGRAAH